MNIIDWMKATSYWMQQDRPDLYPTASDALNDLESWMEAIRSIPEAAGKETGGFILIHSDEDGAEEWQLAKVISSAIVFTPENDCLVLGHTKSSGTLKVGVALPDVIDELPDDFDS